MKKVVIREQEGETLLDHLLFHRGIVGQDEKERFLYPSYEEGLNDPYLLSGMEKAVSRIDEAIKKEEKILIYSDYDADGIPGAVVLSDFFKMIGYMNVTNYIPHRHDEGFGLHEEAIEIISKNGITLLITVDCGITDIKEVEKANGLGIDVIITDHHLPGEALPEAFAIIDPKLSPEYPDQMICGSGVAFKIVQAMLSKDRRGVPEGKEKWLLDMVGLATLSDMVPLKGENRIFAKYGLKVLQKSPRPGIQKLLSSLKISQKDVTEDDIAFMVTPRINVASRMGSPTDAFKLLSTDDPAEAAMLVEKLNLLNDERKGVVAAIVKEIKNKINKRGLKEKKVIVLGNPSWKPAVLGLVANSLMKEYQKPAFLWGRSGSESGTDELLKGSCRSEGQTDVVALMSNVPKGLFDDFGGHKMSGGFSVSTENIHRLDEALNASYEELFSKNIKDEEKQAVDRVISIDDIDFSLWNIVEKLAPFGIDNHKPIFLFKDIVPTVVKRFGKKSEHLELVFNKQNQKKVSAIYFFTEDNPEFSALSAGTPFTLLATLEKSTFRGFPELRLRIVDVSVVLQ